jgi:hypothetical protein
MEDAPYLHAGIVMRVGPTPGCHQDPLGLLAQGADLRIIISGLSEILAVYQ